MEIFTVAKGNKEVKVIQPFENDIWIWTREKDNPIRTKTIVSKNGTTEESLKENLYRLIDSDTADRTIELIRIYLEEDFRYTVSLFNDFRFTCPGCKEFLNVMTDTSVMGMVKVNQRGNPAEENAVYFGNIHGFVTPKDSVFSFECDECNKSIGAELWNTLIYTDGHEEILFQDTSMINKLFLKGILTHAVTEDEYTGEYEEAQSITKEAAINLLKFAYPDATKESIESVLNELYEECKNEDIQNGCYN